MSNIIEQLKGSISAQMLSDVAKSLGESEENVSKGLGATFSALLSAFIKKITKGDLFQHKDALVDLLKNTPLKEKMCSLELSNTLKNKNNPEESGNKFISFLLGDKVNAIKEVISKVSGLKDNSVSSLLALGAPLIMSKLGKDMKGNNSSLSDLAAKLLLDKNAILQAAPAGMSSLLGDFDLNKVGGVTTAFKEKMEDFKELAINVEEKAENILKKKRSPLLTIIPIALAIGLLLFLWKGCSEAENTADNQMRNNELSSQMRLLTSRALADKKIDGKKLADELNLSIDEVALTVDNAKNAAVELANELESTETEVIDALDSVNLWSHLGAFSLLNLPNDVELNIPEFGIERKLLNFIEDENQVVNKASWFSFDRVTFDINKSILKEESSEQLSNIMEIMTAFPDVNIKVGGYADKTGSKQTNLELSQKRADAVKAKLVELGVDGSRIEAEGYGEEHPVASNETAEGRAKNRRIDVLITNK